MPVRPTYPGVYVEEIPSGVRTIIGVATSITAFIGRALRGPLNDPKVINNYGDFERIFGGLWKDSKLGYAVRDFYLNGGSQAVIVRLFRPNIAEATQEAQTAADAVAKAAADAAAPAGVTAAAVAAAATTTAADKGKAGEYAKKAADAVAKAATDAAAAANPTAKSVADAAQNAVIAAVAAAQPVITGRVEVKDAGLQAQVAADAVAKAAADAVTGAADANAVATAANAAAAGKAGVAKAAADAVAKAASDAAKPANATPQTVADAAQKAVPTAVAAAIVGASSPSDLNLEAAAPGAWGGYLRVMIDTDVSEQYATANGLDKNDLFNLTVRDTKAKITESFRNLTIPGKESSRKIDKVLMNESQFVRLATPPPTARPNAHQAVPAGEDPWAKDSYSTGVTKIPTDGADLTKNEFVGVGKETAKEGLYALLKADLVNIICIPPYDSTNTVSMDLYVQAVKYCEDHRAMLLIDPPVSWKSKDHALKVDTDVKITSKNAAIFFPLLRETNPLNDDQVEEFVPSGAVAGIFARTDTERGVWKAPAGLDATIKGVQELSVPLTDPENGELNPLGVNCIRSMPVVGPVVWGTRTRQGDDRLASEWKYIPIRRLALYIEESLFRGTQWVVFEPNDEPLWAQIRLNVGVFMHGLYSQGAFAGTSPKDAYFVKCDKDTNPQAEIDKGIVNIVVGFAPLKPAEFVIIKIQQMAGQLQT